MSETRETHKHCDHQGRDMTTPEYIATLYVCCHCGREREERKPIDRGVYRWIKDGEDKHGPHAPRTVARFR